MRRFDGMESQMIDKNDIMACLKDLLEDKADFALLFGSWAGEGLGMTAESDVDCGVFFLPTGCCGQVLVGTA